MKKNRLYKIGNSGGHDHMFYVDNNQVLTWARNDRIRAFLTSDKKQDVKMDNLKQDCRHFVVAVNNLPELAEYNLGMFQEDIDQMFYDFMNYIREEIDLGSLGIMIE